MAEMLVHTWQTRNELDASGCYVREKHTLVHFLFECLTACDLSDFNEQNVLFDLEIRPELIDAGPAFRVTLDSSYGLSGSLVCGRVVVAQVAPCDSEGRSTDEG